MLIMYIMDFKEIIQKARPNLKNNSLTNYINNLKKLNDNTDFKSVSFLKNTDEIIKKLAHYKDTTKRNYLNSIIVILNAISSDEYKKEIEFYNKQLVDTNKLINDNYEKKEFTADEKKKYINLQGLQSIFKTIDDKVKKQHFEDKININESQRKLILEYLIAGLYTLTPPLRLTYSNMEIINNPKDIKPKTNYLLITGKFKKQFILQDFKNVEKLGKVQIAIPKELNLVINLYLKYHSGNDFLLNTRGFKMSSNSLGKFLMKIFGVNLNLIRKSHVNDVLDIDKLKKEEEFHKNMLHTGSVAKKIYMKNDA